MSFSFRDTRSVVDRGLRKVKTGKEMSVGPEGRDPGNENDKEDELFGSGSFEEGRVKNTKKKKKLKKCLESFQKEPVK